MLDFHQTLMLLEARFGFIQNEFETVRFDYSLVR